MDNLIDIGLNLMHSSFKKDREEIIQEAAKVGVTKAIITGTNIKSSQIASEYASKFPNILYSTSGVHPHDAKTCDENTIETLKKIAKSDSVVAIGECGLDFNRDFSPRDVQREWFEKQIILAEELSMPLFLHERDAHEAMMEILENHEKIAKKAVIHCFTGTEEEAKNYIELGCYIGVTGWICDMKRGKSLQKAVKVIPNNRLMIETDAPFLIPKNFDKKPKRNRNEPKYLPHVLKTIAHYKDEDFEKLALDVTKTTKEFFNI